MKFHNKTDISPGMVRFLVCVEEKAIVLSSDCLIPCHYKTKFIQIYLPQTVPTPAIVSSDSAAVIEAKTLPQTRPPFVNAAADIAAIAAVSAPGI